MNYEDLVASLNQNAEKTLRPVSLTLPGIGTVYVRKRTVLEYEQMSDMRKAVAEGASEELKPVGVLATSLARYLCDEEGKRFTFEQQKTLAEVLSKQPEEVLQRILGATDGDGKEDTPGK